MQMYYLGHGNMFSSLCYGLASELALCWFYSANQTLDARKVWRANRNICSLQEAGFRLTAFQDLFVCEKFKSTLEGKSFLEQILIPFVFSVLLGIKHSENVQCW